MDIAAGWRRTLGRVATIAAVASLVAACGQQTGPAPVFDMLGGVPAAAPLPPVPPHQITVRRGQTLDGIAHSFHVPPAAIVAANRLKPPYELKAGMRLTIPGGSGPPPVQQAMAPPPGPPPLQQAMAPPAPPPQSSPPALSAAPVPQPPAHPETLTPPAAKPAAATSPAAPPVAPDKALPDIIPLDGPPPKPQAPAVPRATLSPPAAPAPAATASAGAPPVTAPRNAAAALPLPGEAADTAPAETAAGRFPWPVRGRILANYGSTVGGVHNDGINIGAARGTPVRAIDAGTVAYAGNEVKGYGNLVLIRHANGWISAYAHLDDVSVKPGDKVAAGQAFARVGESGGVGEPQLHFELRRGKRPVDPREFLAPSPSAAAPGNKAG